MRKRVNTAKRNAYIIGAFIVVLMFGSVLALFANPISSRATTAKYNDLEFALTNNGWTAWLGKQQVSFGYLPFDLENITMPAQINREADKIYIVNEVPEDINAYYPLDRVKSMIYYYTKARFVEACLSEETCDEEKPIIDCGEINAQAIVFSSGNETKTYADFQCLIFQFNVEGNESLTRVNNELDMTSERIIYNILGIMN
jgi:hypothetical protein